MVDQDLVEGTPGRRKGRGIIVFVVGFVLGIVAVIVARPILGERLPEAVGGRRASVSGPVAAKKLDDGRLLLTIVTPEGAVLGTFEKRVEEINLLVEEGDEVTLTIPGYQPFLKDPEITRVVKPSERPEAAEKGLTEVAPDSLTEPPDSLEEADSLTSEPAGRWFD